MIIIVALLFLLLTIKLYRMSVKNDKLSASLTALEAAVANQQGGLTASEADTAIARVDAVTATLTGTTPVATDNAGQ